MTPPDVPHRVYRCWDAEGQLVYIGCTSRSVTKRMSNHRHGNRRVWAATVRIETTEYPSKQTGREAEAQAIADEMPLLNIQHNWRRYPPAVETLPHVQVFPGETVRERKWEAMYALRMAHAP